MMNTIARKRASAQTGPTVICDSTHRGCGEKSGGNGCPHRTPHRQTAHCKHGYCSLVHGECGCKETDV